MDKSAPLVEKFIYIQNVVMTPKAFITGFSELNNFGYHLEAAKSQEQDPPKWVLHHYTVGQIEKSRSTTKAQPEFADTMAPRVPVKYHGFAPEAGRLKSIFRGDSRFQMVPRAKPGHPGG
ncbi:hypothetical protein PGT21_033040 [Puccinia graminis f. sp. tritici]|uniref:Uncharacterized protein n=1 Tax=Puccinia graminis f. sp. tritici TaxID=56615 RepID=A0A5B0Q988_PUCGR|nr:hypothetical protein PGTUg99_030417 [Puccinia graminis f. sp. tritici]KAA1119741.1 hypothetical protein PGT21_033040 [Puccinia graminis f. sp. tritici]